MTKTQDFVVFRPANSLNISVASQTKFCYTFDITAT